MIEDELIDDYVLHRLNPLDRSCFETHFLTTPERIQSLQFSHALFSFLKRKREEAA
jgi:hypothetical protein